MNSYVINIEFLVVIFHNFLFWETKKTNFWRIFIWLLIFFFYCKSNLYELIYLYLLNVSIYTNYMSGENAN